MRTEQGTKSYSPNICNFAARFLRILRWRTDKPVEEIDTLETVKKLAQS